MALFGSSSVGDVLVRDSEADATLDQAQDVFVTGGNVTVTGHVEDIHVYEEANIIVDDPEDVIYGIGLADDYADFALDGDISQYGDVEVRGSGESYDSVEDVFVSGGNVSIEAAEDVFVVGSANLTVETAGDVLVTPSVPEGIVEATTPEDVIYQDE